MAAAPEGMKIQGKILISATNKHTKRQGGHIEISDSVTEIGEFAFFYDTSLRSVIMSGSVTKIEGFAFSRCTNLQSVTIPDSVTKIGYHAFSNCISLQSIKIHDSVTEIGLGAFFGCTNLTKITIIASDLNYEKAEQLKAKLPENLRKFVEFELSTACNIKGNPSGFFSQPSDSNSAQPESSSSSSPAP